MATDIAFALGDRVPIYRELLAGNFNRPEPIVRLWVTAASALIQIGYWLRYLHQTSPSLPRRVLLGDVLMFLARVNFIFTGGVFSAVFFVRFDQVKFSLSGTGLLLAILFSMFCVSLDLERIGQAFLMPPEGASGRFLESISEQEPGESGISRRTRAPSDR
jgi:hypothetical protein